LHEYNIEKNTILVFTSDHGDMLYSQGQKKKQQPWDESILVPFLLHYPAVLGRKGKRIDMPFNTPDIMPTLLGLCGITIPDSVEGNNFSDVLKGEQEPDNEAALIMCPAPFGQYRRSLGGKEYRGIRTRRYTFVRDLEGPWLLYDNKNDPYQMQNLVNKPETIAVQRELEVLLSKKLQETNDAFKPAEKYIKKWDITVDETGTVPYTI